MVILVPGLLAFIFSALAFGSRVTGVYFSIITQALVFTLMLAFFQNNFGFGGNNGLTDFKDILGKDISSKETRGALYICSAFMLILGYLICRIIISSKIGNILVGIRDRENRMRGISEPLDLTYTWPRLGNWAWVKSRPHDVTESNFYTLK